MIVLKNSFSNISDAKNLIIQSEKDYVSEIEFIAKEICKKPDVKWITLAGPTCSGKTTTAARLTDFLDKLGKRSRVISVDDFFFGKKEREQMGITDVEGIAAINISLFENVINDLSCKRPTKIPTFDFVKRTPAAKTDYYPENNDIYIIEGIQAVYPEVVAILKPYGYKSIFINVAEDVEVKDKGVTFTKEELRLIRRVVRDNKHRDTTPEETMGKWKSVRENEIKNIFPYVHGLDYVINSALKYEVLLMSRYFLSVTDNYDSNARHKDAMEDIRERLKKLDDTAVSIDLVPFSSVIREFTD